jgi:hypothetical protein
LSYAYGKQIDKKFNGTYLNLEFEELQAEQSATAFGRLSDLTPEQHFKQI